MSPVISFSASVRPFVTFTSCLPLTFGLSILRAMACDWKQEATLWISISQRKFFHRWLEPAGLLFIFQYDSFLLSHV